MLPVPAILQLPSSVLYVAVPLLVTLNLYALYRWLLPKPLPGIAYNPEAVRSLLGDAPDMVKEVSVTGELRVWCAKQVVKMNAPICQVFIRPFSKPWVLVADFSEAREILTRRKEFDKSSLISDGMACLGDFHGVFQTGDRFKANRQLIQDLMTGSFHHRFMGPAIYSEALNLIRLWEIKMSAAKGRPFSVKTDFEYTSLDVMLHFAFGPNYAPRAIEEQVRYLSGSSALASVPVGGESPDEPIDFPKAPINDFLKAVYEVPELVEKLINAVAPKLNQWWWSKQSWYKKTFAAKDRVLKEQIDMAISNYRSGQCETGLEHMLMREDARAQKQGRQPDFHNHVFVDEMFGNIIGGHHTTSGGMMWLTKYLTDLPQIQTSLRGHLHTQFPSAHSHHRAPTFDEIRSARLPYLDAIVEEFLRLNAVTVTREALSDTTVLGQHVPKGTQVFLVSNGPGFLSQSIVAPQTHQSNSAYNKARDLWGGADDDDLKTFRPERWLVRRPTGDNDTNLEFDGAAGPQLAFGLGPRGCWGRKLAMLEMRVVVVLLVWHFELLATPAEVSGYAGLEGIARVPQQCYVRLRKL